MFVPEEELAVQIGEVDSVEVDDMDIAKTAQNKVLQKFATDSTSTDHKYP